MFGSAKSHLVHQLQASCPLCPMAQSHQLQRGFAWTSKACRHARGLSLISPLGFTREDGSSCSTAAIYSFTLKATFLAESKALAVNLWAFKLEPFDEGTVAVSPLLSRPSRGLSAGGQQGTESRQWAVGWREVLGWTRFHCEDPR